MKQNIIISILGPDGSGKSTLIKVLKKKLLRQKKKLKTFHLKPYFVSNKKAKIVKNPHNQVLRSNFLSFLKLLYWLIIFRLYFIIKIFIPSDIFLFDRYPNDILIDPKRYRFKLSSKLSENILKFFPRPDLWIIMIEKPKIIWSRKQEVDYETLIKQINKYKKFAKNKKNSIIFSQRNNISKIEKYLNYNFKV